MKKRKAQTKNVAAKKKVVKKTISRSVGVAKKKACTTHSAFQGKKTVIQKTNKKKVVQKKIAKKMPIKKKSVVKKVSEKRISAAPKKVVKKKGSVKLSPARALDVERRSEERKKCAIAAEYAMYGDSVQKGNTCFYNVSKGGGLIDMKHAPAEEAVMSLAIDRKKMERYIDFDTLVLDPNKKPIARVVHFRKDAKKRNHRVGVRFLAKPVGRG